MVEKTTLLLLKDIFNDYADDDDEMMKTSEVDNKEYNVDCDEVYPNLFVRDDDTATNIEYLRAIGITHVVNMAECDVKTGANFYKDHGIEYLGVDITDFPTTKIDVYFESTTKFIEDALNGGGKVLVHCLVGYSRSPTCAIAYLMIRKGMSAAEACKIVKTKRLCCPNDGFLLQLVDLDDQLKGGKCV